MPSCPPASIIAARYILVSLSLVYLVFNYRIFWTKSRVFFHSLAGGASYTLERLMCEIINILLLVYHFTCYFHTKPQEGALGLC